MKLAEFDNHSFDRGRTRLVEACWRVLEGLFFSSWLPGSAWRVRLLRLFGATVGRGVIIKPRVRVKFPWRLTVGDHSWIGESVWIDNLAQVEIGSNCCVSQGAYLCTGSHDWAKDSFDLVVESIVLEDSVWLSAYSKISPGVTAREGAVLGFGSTATTDLEPWGIYVGSPASFQKQRIIRDSKA